jgi:MFS family permease
MGLFQTYYSLTLLPSHSASAISWIFTTQLFLMWTGGLFYGRLIDVYGTKHIAIPCTLLCTFCVAMLALSTTYVQIFMSQGIGFGLGASGLFTCGIVSIGQWFTKRKALALGVVLSGSSVGGVIHTTYLHVLIRMIGFKWAVLVGALIVGVSGGVSCVLMRGRYSRGIWDRDVAWIDWRLFKQKIFVVYCLGTWFVM